MVVDCFCWQIVGGLFSSKRKRCMDRLFDAAFWCAESNAEDSKTLTFGWILFSDRLELYVNSVWKTEVSLMDPFLLNRICK